jgi:WS/DGAT/MGAT family acyltransferase
VSRLHSHPLDLSRPLWEMHVIEGLEQGRFAFYVKLHHSQFDGKAGVALWDRVLGRQATAGEVTPPWAIGLPARPPQDRSKPAARRSSGLRQTLMHSLSALGAVRQLVGSARAGDDTPASAPYSAPRSILNGAISAQRRLATQQYPLERIRRVADAFGATVNDVFMAICGGALRRYLAELGELPPESMTAGMPVAIRPQGDTSVGNAISLMLASLGTDVDDPAARLEGCRQSARAAKQLLDPLPREALEVFAFMLSGPYMAQVMLGLGAYGRPLYNLVLSNMPGPRELRYFDGARLETVYPFGLLFDGQVLNITASSYAGVFALSFTGCRDRLPSLQRLAVYTGEALAELERAGAARIGNRLA